MNTNEWFISIQFPVECGRIYFQISFDHCHEGIILISVLLIFANDEDSAV